MKLLIYLILFTCSSYAMDLSFYECTQKSLSDTKPIEDAYVKAFDGLEPELWTIDYGFRLMVYLKLKNGTSHLSIDRLKNSIFVHIYSPDYDPQKIINAFENIVTYSFFTVDDEKVKE